MGPIITFTFDDFPRSALTLGGAIVEQFGGRATYYVAMGLKETINELGEQFCSADLHSLVERGHEVAGHSFSHLSARRSLVGEFMADVDHGQEAIRESITANASSNFAYPYGEVTLPVKRKLGPRMDSCRGTCCGFNGPDVDLNLLRANSLHGGIDQAEGARRLITENEKRRTWLIFYTHDVSSNPSPFGCTPELLEEVVSFAVERHSRIATVAEVVAEVNRTA
jgi:peptidoglycan/xylan/chitin deacetylase (PgdA/CDA1 family)